MTQYNTSKVTLFNSQLNKLKLGIINGIAIKLFQLPLKLS